MIGFTKPVLNVMKLTEEEISSCKDVALLNEMRIELVDRRSVFSARGDTAGVIRMEKFLGLVKNRRHALTNPTMRTPTQTTPAYPIEPLRRLHAIWMEVLGEKLPRSLFREIADEVHRRNSDVGYTPKTARERKAVLREKAELEKSNDR